MPLIKRSAFVPQPDLWYVLQFNDLCLQNSGVWELVDSTGLPYQPPSNTSFTPDAGSVYFSGFNQTQQAVYLWQFLAPNSTSTTYLIRPQYLGGNSCLNLSPCAPNDSTCLKGIPLVSPCTPASVSWSIGQWPDTGLSYLYNTATGTDWAFSVLQGSRDGAGAWVTLNETAQIQNEPYMSLSIAKNASILDRAFSSLPVNATTPATLSSALPSPTASPSATAAPSSKTPSNLAGPIAGGVVGGLALLSAIVALLVCRTRRRKYRSLLEANAPPPGESMVADPAELSDDALLRAEMVGEGNIHGKHAELASE